ncbi:MAG: radical SAM protein [Candidatus Altiarchaeota archaeon]
MAPPPMVIVLRPTYRCNLKCIMCDIWKKYQGTGLQNAMEELSTDDYTSFIDQVSKFKPHLHFSGGEPLLRDDIHHLIKHASDKNLMTSINTNGLILKKNAEKLVDHGVHLIYASIDGPEEIHDTIRGTRGSFKKITDGVKKVIDYREKTGSSLPLIQVQSVIMTENHHLLSETAKIVGRLGVDNYSLFLLDYRATSSDEDPLWTREKPPYHSIDTNLIEEQVKSISESNHGFNFRPYPQHNNPSFNIHDYFNDPWNNRSCLGCNVPWTYSDIQPNGDVYFCSNMYARVGNISDQDFMDIWNGTDYSQLRQRLVGKNLNSPIVCGRKRTG